MHNLKYTSRLLPSVLAMGFLTASIPLVAQSSAAPSTPAAAPASKPAAENLPGEGTLFRGFIKPNKWVEVDGDMMIDFSENNRSDALDRTYGEGNLPMVPTDEGIYINTIELNVHREAKSDSMLGFGPLPGIKPSKPDFGYMMQLIYGRCSSGLVGGWDRGWSVNTEAVNNPSSLYYNRANTLILPLFYAYAYLPVLNGTNIYGGILGSGIGHEIHPNTRPTPNLFASHSYSFMDEPDQVIGVQVTGNLYRSSKHLIGYEVGINNGIETTVSANGRPNYVASLHYKSANMRTAVDYTAFLGDSEVAPNKSAADFPSTWHGVISPRGQYYQYHDFNASQVFTPHWSSYTEIVVARQAGDGKSDTINRTTSTGNFRGAQWGGVTVGTSYKVNPKLSYNVRAEHFRDGNGYALPAGVASGYNETTLGAMYDFSKNLVIRPEVRYDWQNAYTSRAYNNASNSSQFSGSVSMILYF
ncbi:outer membrane beta-barrel protein [Telmatobacter bradus]|uniref:outer membrane beta-barrel protein n=1 Tax=Telmatobacter bradus TaxID=474953 RepID=UPI003B42F870